MYRKWVVLACVVGVVLGAAPGADRPDITMLYRGNSQTCVAGSNTDGYGLAFMSETLENSVNINEFQYKDEKGATVNFSSNCDFENRTRCWQRWYSTNIELRESGSDPIAPVTDERWNNFEVYHTDGQNLTPPTYDKSYNIAPENFFIGISVRSTENAQILLCTGQEKNPREDECYWIILDGITKEFDMTIIRKCVQGVPDSWATEPDCKIFRDNITLPGKLLSESKWTHFMLTREIDHRIRLWLWDLNTGVRPLLDYMDDSPLPLLTMYVRSYNAIADWKVHQYRFINIRYKKGLIRLGSTLTFDNIQLICVSLYVTMCSRCKMEIRLEKEDGRILIQSSIEGNTTGQFMTWRNVKMEGADPTSSFSDARYILFATLSTTDGREDNTFWAIDDFRKCSNKEFRVARTYHKNNLLCQSLKDPGWTFNPDKQIETNEPPICSDSGYIGQHCNIPCTVVSRYGCNSQKMCMSTQEDSKNGACTCAAGYMWGSSRCNIRCDSGYYGYSCKNECGKCRNGTGCSRINGECSAGCEDGLLPPDCQTILPHLTSAPTVVKVYFTKLDVEIKDLSIIGNKYIIQAITIECKKTNSKENWFGCSRYILPIAGQKVSIAGLEKETSYLIRAVIYTNGRYAYRNEDLPTTEATTTCKVDREIHITTNPRNVTISFEASNDSCSLENYRLELQQNSKQIKLPQSVAQSMVLVDLTPYTDYEIILTHPRYPLYKENKRFKTKQDAPGEISNLHILDTTDSAVVLSWDEPTEKNGIIQKYIVTYELIQRIDCNDKPSSQKNSIRVLPSEISKVTIPSLQPYSTYLITVVTQTTLPGKSTQLQCNTRITSAITQEELPESISVSDLSARSVTIRWPENCAKQRGPLYFHIVLKCVEDEWCDQTRDIVLHNETSFNGGYTTHNLTPFTHYLVELRAKRSQSGDLTTVSRTIRILSLGGNPPAVRNSTYYSKDNISISLRWLDPYPSHGHLEEYEIKHCYNTNQGCETTEITIIQLTPCDLWYEHFNCYILTNLNSGVQYTISITARNNESVLWGPVSSLEVFTAEDTSSAPLNLTHQWKNSEVNLYWNHPDITNGRLRRFVITLNQTGTELKNQDGESFYSYKYPIIQEMKTYIYPINKKYRYSSSYLVTVCGVNSHYGVNATLRIDTPPETPVLTAGITVDDQVTTQSIVTVIIPGIKKETISQDSFLYVVVSKINTISKTNIEEGSSSSLKKEILKHSSYEHAWIAKEIIGLNENKLKVYLGSEEITDSQQLNEIIINHKLEASTAYEITLVLINRYNNEYSIKVYHHNIRTASNSKPELYALLLFLLLPVVIYFLYRLRKKKNGS